MAPVAQEIAPSVTRVAAIFNPDTQPYATSFSQAIEAAAPSFGNHGHARPGSR
jgi:hypothetical protein